MHLPDNLTGMLTTVVAMAELLNVSRVAQRLNKSRITIAKFLESANKTCGVEIFKLEGREYKITREGVNVVALANEILHKSNNFTNATASQLRGLAYVKLYGDAGTTYAQQHPLNRAWSLGTPKIRATISAWTVSKGLITADDFQPIRDRLLFVRKELDRWILVEVGERSAMAHWLGADIAKSAIGRPIVQNHLGKAAKGFLLPPLEHVMTFGGIWYDHVSGIFPNPQTKVSERAEYQRLVMRCEFPDSSPVLVTLIDFSDVSIIDAPSKFLSTEIH